MANIMCPAAYKYIAQAIEGSFVVARPGQKYKECARCGREIEAGERHWRADIGRGKRKRLCEMCAEFTVALIE